jgi:hypothetical protein
MGTAIENKPSFSPQDRWRIALQVAVTTLVVVCAVGMINYLSGEYFARHHLAASTRMILSARTQHVLRNLTNNVNVILYYDKEEPLFSDVSDLLNEYHLANSKITVQTVDYLRDPGLAQKIKAQYNLTSPTEKNLVIFDCGGKRRIVDGTGLAQYVMEQVMGEKDQEFRRKPTAFLGEMAFTGALLDVSNPKPFKAYFLRGHGEHSPTSGEEYGYMKFVSVLQHNYIRVEPITLGTNAIPMDCNLLVIAGPTRALPDVEIETIERYLAQGGRVLALLNWQAIDKETGRDRTGLDKVFYAWGVGLGSRPLQDPENTIRGSDMIVLDFNRQHPLVNPLLNSGLYMVQPRAVGKLPVPPKTADVPNVEEVAHSGPKTIGADPNRPGRYPVMVALEKGGLKGVITERGSTRMVVVGDSIFLANAWIESAANRDFAGFAANWLLDRSQLLSGVGPRPIQEYRLVMTRSQLHAAQWILLAAMPGTALAIGGMVWLRRRR